MFSIDANASQTTPLRCEEEAYYALWSSFIPLWRGGANNTETLICIGHNEGVSNHTSVRDGIMKDAVCVNEAIKT